AGDAAAASARLRDARHASLCRSGARHLRRRSRRRTDDRDRGTRAGDRPRTHRPPDWHRVISTAAGSNSAARAADKKAPKFSEDKTLLSESMLHLHGANPMVNMLILAAGAVVALAT